ncbi:peptidoglycan-binding protein LysM [Pseudomonas asuensis]|uniref:Peptidoglycan-binding protein LysM n=1 Tax=Pseudomonas asuensis TaxID=1825787 RepID=A0ABQ2GGP1_9PSED|nr:peptidoglycan-binding protein LysM [Pseudomonas asuensis]
MQVVDRSGGSANTYRVTKGQYTVRRGDTLYAIASRNGWDWRSLAAHNGISPPYVIHVGQKINFGGSSSSTVATTSRRPPQTGSSTPVATASVPVNTPTATAAPAAPPVAQNIPAAPPAVTAPPATTPTANVPQSSAGWAWPAKGTLISRYSSNGSLNKGIDIAGDLGQPVLAASGGTVVYAGSGLRGYGELIIIKHNETYVSAYGHNRRLLVREGQQVKVGQTIAEMGSTGTDRVKLHFEIRRQGKPVDPLQYLPNR